MLLLTPPAAAAEAAEELGRMMSGRVGLASDAISSAFTFGMD